jgi:hypothetical protein
MSSGHTHHSILTLNLRIVFFVLGASEVMHLSLLTTESVQRTFHAQGTVRHTQHSIKKLNLRIDSFGFASK